MKVRIGNDIRLNLTLKGPRSFDLTNIKELKCFLINTSVLDYNPLATVCAKRYPGCCGNRCNGCCGKCCDMKHPTSPIGMHCCKTPGYFSDPFECECCHKCCHKHEKYPYTPVNPTFGEGPLRPNYGHCGCYDHDNYCRYGHLDPRSKCYDGYCWDERHCAPYYFRPGYNDFIAPHLDENFRYIADSKVLPGKNRIQTYFPARDQFMCGDYKLVVVVVVYESGWGRCDLHTYTIDYGTVVTLVDDDSAVSGSVTIDVDNDALEGSDIETIYIESPDLYLKSGGSIAIGERDEEDNVYKIGVVFKNGNYVEYNPESWYYYEPLQFSTEDEILTVNSKGVIEADLTKANVDAVVNVKSKEFSTQINVHVAGSEKDYIGFSSSNNYRTIWGEIEQGDDFIVCENGIFGTHNVTLNGADKYLWIVSTKPIADINSANPISVTVSMFDVPLVYDGKHEDMYYYHCPNVLSSETQGAIGSITFDITVEEK